MRKTDNFFLIHNYNTVPLDLLEYCDNYLIYDASDDPVVKEQIKDLNHIDVPNTGHNITTYFQYFADHYENLPNVMVLLKGNIIGRHLSKDFFDRVYDNHYYTFLYEDKSVRAKVKKEVFFLSMENEFVEYNDSWYVNTDHPKKYFACFNDLLTFVYRDPVIPEYCCFAPGACYIVLKEQVLKHPREFYLNLNKIMNYTVVPKFPSEAHQIERLLHVIFNANYEENPWMNDEQAFLKALEARGPLQLQQKRHKKSILYRAVRKVNRYLDRMLEDMK